MLILVDANIFISYLLNPADASPPARLVSTMFFGHPDMEFLVSETSLQEVSESVRRKPYLSRRIPAATLEQFIHALSLAIRIVPPIPGPIARLSRDENDDYLWSTGLRHGVDILVSGDKDVLILDPVEQMRIISPAVFMNYVDALTI